MKGNQVKSIKFYPSSIITESSVPPPRPASEYLPEWYKNIKTFSGTGHKNKPQYADGKVINKTVKTCYPFWDALTSGYIQESWCDIRINFENDIFFYDYSVGPEPLSHRSKVSINLSESFMPYEFIWQVHWVPKLDYGYSALITHPFNRLDLPFLNTSGIIDSDKFFHSSPGNYPFYLYKTSKNEIFIPSGTPLYQIIPIKRDSWRSNPEEFNEKEYLKRSAESQRSFIGTYKKFFHQKKVYK